MPVDFPYTRINPKGKNPANLVQQNLEYYTEKSDNDLADLVARVEALETAGAASGEMAYVQTTSSVSVTSTNETTAPNDLLTLPPTTFDGSTIVVLEFHCGTFNWGSGAVAPNCIVNLWDATTRLGRIAWMGWGGFPNVTSGDIQVPVHVFYHFTPAAGTITYRIRASVSGAAAGNFTCSGAHMPMWARISKA